jgi:hypothetical protein
MDISARILRKLDLWDFEVPTTQSAIGYNR